MRPSSVHLAAGAARRGSVPGSYSACAVPIQESSALTRTDARNPSEAPPHPSLQKSKGFESPSVQWLVRQTASATQAWP